MNNFPSLLQCHVFLIPDAWTPVAVSPTTFVFTQLQWVCARSTIHIILRIRHLLIIQRPHCSFQTVSNNHSETFSAMGAIVCSSLSFGPHLSSPQRHCLRSVRGRFVRLRESGDIWTIMLLCCARRPRLSGRSGRGRLMKWWIGALPRPAWLCSRSQTHKLLPRSTEKCWKDGRCLSTPSVSVIVSVLAANYDVFIPADDKSNPELTRSQNTRGTKNNLKWPCLKNTFDVGFLLWSMSHPQTWRR